MLPICQDSNGTYRFMWNLNHNGGWNSITRNTTFWPLGGMRGGRTAAIETNKRKNLMSLLVAHLTACVRRNFLLLSSGVMMCCRLQILSIVSPFLSLSGAEVFLGLFPFLLVRSSVLSFEGCQLSSWLWEVLFSCLRLWPFVFSLLSFVFCPLRVVKTNLWSCFLLFRSSGGLQVILSRDLVGALAPCFFRVGACCFWPLAIPYCFLRFSSALWGFAAFGLVGPWKGFLWGTLEVVGIFSVGSWRRSLLCLALLHLRIFGSSVFWRQLLCVWQLFGSIFCSCCLLEYVYAPVLRSFLFLLQHMSAGVLVAFSLWVPYVFSFASCCALAHFGYLCPLSLLIPFLTVLNKCCFFFFFFFFFFFKGGLGM